MRDSWHDEEQRSPCAMAVELVREESEHVDKLGQWIELEVAATRMQPCLECRRADTRPRARGGPSVPRREPVEPVEGWWRRLPAFNLQVLHFIDQRINLPQESLAAAVWAACDHFRRQLCQCNLAGVAGPAAGLAIGDQSQSTQIALPARMYEFSENVFEAQLKCR